MHKETQEHNLKILKTHTNRTNTIQGVYTTRRGGAYHKDTWSTNEQHQLHSHHVTPTRKYRQQTLTGPCHLVRAIILLSHGHRNRQREINQPQSRTRAGTTTAKGTHKDSSSQPGQRGHKRGQCTQRGKGSRLIVTSRKHIARNTIRPATPPRHTPDHAHTCKPGEETKHIRPLDTQPSTKPPKPYTNHEP